MFQIVGSGIVIIFLLFIFELYGYAVGDVLKLEWISHSERLLFGMLSYFICFQIVALPFVLLKGSLIQLSLVWGCISLVFFLFMVFRKKKEIIQEMKENFLKKNDISIFCMMVVVVVAIFFSVLQSYNGWDTAYYLGGMNTSLATNTFYLFDGHTGEPQGTITLHYALSTFYVHFTVMCKIFHIEVRIMAFYCMRGLCVILASMTVYLLGRKLFQRKQDAAGLVILWMFFNCFATALHSTAFFLFIRGYEAKGYCANILFPLLLYGIVSIFQEEKAENWKKIEVISFASVPLSMSSVAILPMAIGVMGIVLMIKKRKILNIMKHCMICVLPNICYLTIYALYVKGILSIGAM